MITDESRDRYRNDDGAGGSNNDHDEWTVYGKR